MIAFPFDSQIVGYEDNGMPIYDRASNAEEFARLLSAFLRDGVFNDSMCAVMENEGMTAVVSSGNMMIQGRYGYIEEAESVAFEAADTANPRIDTVVLRRDLSTDVNNIVVAVVKGTPAASPVAPALTRDGTIWELGIADVYIGANVSVITQANITDTRLDESRCGIVAAILTDINTETFNLQFRELITEMQESLQAVYDGVEMVNISEITGTLTADGWTDAAPYVQTIEATGVLAADKPFVDLDLTDAASTDDMEALQTAWSNVVKATADANAVSFVALNRPEIDIPVKVKVVR